MYQKSEDKLFEGGEKEEIKDIFNAIALFKGKIDSAEILFNYFDDSECFKNPVLALGVTLNIINQGKVPDEKEFRTLINGNENLNNLIENGLYARKDNALYKNEQGGIDYLPFNTNGMKFVVIKIKSKKENIRRKLSDAFINIKEGINKNTDNIYEKYCINEKKRVEEICINILKYKTVNDELSDILEKSAEELCLISGGYGKKLFEVFKSAQGTGLTKCCILAYDIGGVCVIVKDCNVDKFIDVFSKEYLKKTGERAQFFICDTKNSGVKMKEPPEEIKL